MVVVGKDCLLNEDIVTNDIWLDGCQRMFLNFCLKERRYERQVSLDPLIYKPYILAYEMVDDFS